MFEIFNYPDSTKELFIYFVLSFIFALASAILYKYATRKWHFSVAKFFIEIVTKMYITLFPVYFIIEYLSNESTMLWYIGGYFVLMLGFIKKLIAIEESIIERLQKLNRNFQN